ncbi:MAG: HAD family hydrolase [Candidatus Nanoarchaeia archaeon]|nr:HAD family hydrolase [Candidatus Nanoarchaeia archaeon]
MAIFFFDVDGTIADNMGVHYETFNIIFSKFNLKMPLSLWQNEYIGQPGFEIIKQFLKKNKIRYNDLDIEILRNLRDEIYDKMLDNKYVRPFDGLIYFLEESKKKGNIHIITSNSILENVQRFLKIHDLEKYFDEICTPENYKPKPSFDMFEKMFQKYNNYTKDQSIFFEDSILGAKTGIDYGLKTFIIKKTYGDMLKVVFKNEIKDERVKVIKDYKDSNLKKIVNY